MSGRINPGTMVGGAAALGLAAGLASGIIPEFVAGVAGLWETAGLACESGLVCR